MSMQKNEGKYSVLLTGAGAPGMPGVLKCLRKVKECDLQIIGVDMDTNAPSRKDFDSFYTVPRAEHPAFIPQLLKICKLKKVDIVVPCVTRELLKFAEARQQFKEIGVRVAVMEPSLIELVNDKGALLTTIKNGGLPTAEFYLADNMEEFLEAIDNIGYPEKAFCVKAVTGNGSRGVRLVDPHISKSKLFFDEKPNGMYISKEELVATLKETETFPKQIMIMQFLPGEEYSVDMVVQQGNVLAEVCRRGLAVVSSNQTSSVVENEPAVLQLCRQVAKLLCLNGNIGFDIKCDEKGTPFVIEINPRYTGGIVACLAAGANMPWLGIKNWMGIPIEQPQLMFGVRMQRFWNERFYDANDCLMEI